MGDAVSGQGAGPVLLVGAGALGGALLQGWLGAAAFPPSAILVRDPKPSEAVRACGARLNLPDAELAAARLVVLAVKPQGWRAAAAELAPLLAPDAVIVSAMAGVRVRDLAAAFGGRPVARTMPTTAVAIGRGAASVFAPAPAARAAAHALFDPVATVVDLDDEGLIDAATGVSGSAPAYLYAFVEALAAAGETAGLPHAAAALLARATVEGAAALMAQSGATPAELRAQVTSPRGTTEAALDVLLAREGLPDLMRHTVAAAVKRSRELAGAATSGGGKG